MPPSLKITPDCFNMIKRLLSLIILLLMLAIANNALADRIIYKNGESLSGNIVSLQDGILLFNTKSAGQLSVNLSELKAIETDKQLRIVFTNNDTLTGKINIADKHGIHIETERFGTLEDISLGEIKSLQIMEEIQLLGTASDTHNLPADLPDQSSQPTGEVLLTSGDRLLGDIKSIDEKNLVMSTDFSNDDLTISRDKIASIKSDNPLTVLFGEDDYLIGEIKPSDNNRLIVKNTDNNESREFQLSEVEEVYIGDPEQKRIEEEKFKYSGNINIGIELESGNTDEDTYMLTSNFRARDPDDRYTVRFDKLYEKTNGEKTEDETNLFLKYDHFFSGKWFSFAGAIFEQDRIDLLKLRTTLAAGLGYQFFETKNHFLSVDAGPAYVDEQFEEGEEDEEDNDFYAMKWGVDYEYQLFEWARFFHFHDGLLGVEDIDDTLITSQTGFRIPLTKRFNATLQANIDWEKSPPATVEQTDKEYLITLGYEF